MHALRIGTYAAMALSLTLGAPAMADDFARDKPREEVYCFPAKYATDLVEKLANADADKKDVVNSILAPRFRIFDGGELPQRFFIRGASETDFTLGEDGRVPDFLTKVERAENTADLCIQDINRVGRPGDDEGLYFEMGLTPKFKNRSGQYTLDELKEGASDGKSLYKKMIPKVARMFMPDTKHMSLRYDDITTPLQISSYKGDVKLEDITAELYNESHVFSLKDLKNIGADRIVIEGGTYQLSPVPSIKTMKKFGIGEKNVTTETGG